MEDNESWNWLLLLVLTSILFKDSLTNFFIGVRFLLGNEFNVDDIVYIRGNKKARILKQNLWKTTFYVYNHERKFIVPNNNLWKLDMEKEAISKNEKKFTKEELELIASYLRMKRDINSKINKV